MKRYIFIGDENDSRTKGWRIKNGETYEIELKPFNEKYKLEAEIKLVNSKIFCPYKSIESFNSNWKLTI